MFKKLFLLFVFSILGLTCNAEKYPTPILTIDTLNYELGDVYQSDSIKVIKVHWKNTGDADLHFYEVNSGCHCLKVNYKEFEGKTFKPNSEGFFILTLDINQLYKEFYREVYIFSNATPKQESINITLHGIKHRGGRKQI